MQAILIVTGQENKLRPLTTTMPSPMLPVVDRPVMVYVIELLARAGCRDIVVSLPDQAHSIVNYFGTGARWNVHIRYLVQSTSCGLASLLTSVNPAQRETVLVLPADAIVDVDVEAALAYHRASNGMVTTILSRIAASIASSAPASVVIEESATALHRDDQHQPLATSIGKEEIYVDTGAFLFEPAALDYLPDRPDATYPQWMAALQGAEQIVQSYMMEGYWNPLTTFGDFQAAQNIVLASLSPKRRTSQQAVIRHPYIEAGELQPGVWVAPNSIIHPSVGLTPPLFIGAGCRIGRDVELGPNTIINAGSVIDEGVTVQQSTILSHTYVGQYLHLAQRVAHQAELIDIETGINIEITDPWLLNAVTAALSSNVLSTLWQSLLSLAPVAWFRGRRNTKSQPQPNFIEKSGQRLQVQRTSHSYRNERNRQPATTAFQEQSAALLISQPDQLY